MTRRLRRLVTGLGALAFGTVLLAGTAQAHPLGNFTVNTFHGLRISADAVQVDAVVDLAEIPTVTARPAVDRDRDGRLSAAEAAGYAGERCEALLRDATLSLDGRETPMRVAAAEVALLPGNAGLETLRLNCTLRTVDGVDTVGTRVAFASRHLVDRVGWREIVAAGDGVALRGSTVPDRSSSDALRAYPEDLLSRPLDQRQAGADVVAGDGTFGPDREESASLLPRGADRFAAAFQRLVARPELSVGYAVLALLTATLLGVVHAFAPGHGKTVMAAYLVGRSGRMRHAATLALSVTATHTLGVLVLGVLLTSATVVAPERIYPWLGLASGLLLAVVGFGLLARAGGLRERLRHAWDHRRHHAHEHAPEAAHQHGHDHEHPHDHGEPHRHGWGRAHSHVLPEEPRLRSLLGLGLAGGLVPSPSALVVLLGAIALDRAAFGLALVVAFGAGMALALVGTGLVLVHARDRAQRWLGGSTRLAGRGWPARLAGALPVLTAAMVTVVGVGIATRGALQL